MLVAAVEGMPRCLGLVPQVSGKLYIAGGFSVQPRESGPAVLRAAAGPIKSTVCPNVLHLPGVIAPFQDFFSGLPENQDVFSIEISVSVFYLGFFSFAVAIESTAVHHPVLNDQLLGSVPVHIQDGVAPEDKPIGSPQLLGLLRIGWDRHFLLVVLAIEAPAIQDFLLPGDRFISLLGCHRCSRLRFSLLPVRSQAEPDQGSRRQHRCQHSGKGQHPPPGMPLSPGPHPALAKSFRLDYVVRAHISQ